MPDPRRVLLIGASGLVGRHLLAAFRGLDVVATYHRTPVEGATPLDLEDADAIRRLFRTAHADVAVLAAAEAHVERCEREPEATRRVNVDAARVVAEEVDRAAASLVAFSSEYVFDGTKGTYAEGDRVAPLNEYGRQKVDLETVVLRSPRNLVIRTSGVFGRDPAGTNFVLQLCRSGREGRPFRVPSDQLITPALAPSLATAVAALLERGASGVVHAGGPRILDRVDFALMVCDAFGLDRRLILPTPTRDLGLAAPRPLRAGLVDGHLRSLIGRGLADPQEGLREMSGPLIPPPPP